MSCRPVSENSSTCGPCSTANEESAHPIARAIVSVQEVDLEVAAASGHVRGAEIDLFSASAGATADDVIFQGGLARMRTGTGQGAYSASLETFTFKASAGHTNPDGSYGSHVGASATVVGIEGTATFLGATSITLGLSAGVGGEVSVGTRDLDKDGNPEMCARISLAFLTVGLCLENPF